jgi:peptide/nickel transport system substrate-binding protein
MRSLPGRTAGLAVPLLTAVLAAGGLAGCSNSGGSGSSASGTPVRGGTLRVISNTGPGTLDPVPTYNYAGYELERAYTRQLLTYVATPMTISSGPEWAKATTVVPDAAAEVPTAANGGISADGLTYTYHIRPGVEWSSSPPRQVTAADFTREFKAFCNPKFPVGNSTYFTTTIAGFSSYCDAENSHFGAKNAPAATAASVAAWQNSHTISGLSAPSTLILQVKLIQPASDFNNIMAMPFVSARPAEYDSYLPGSDQLNQHTMSDGPYEVSSYVPDKSITLTRSPAWKQSTDPVRHQYVSKVVVTMGTSSDQTALTDMQAGSQDLNLADLSLPSPSIAPLRASNDKRLRIWPSSNLYRFITLNLRSPNAGGAVKKLAVRQAIEYGVNKSAVVKVSGGPALNAIASSAIPPGNAGYQPYNLYPSPGNAGDTAKCKALLAQAGYPHGLTLTYLHENDTANTTFFESLQGSLANCGIKLQGRSVPSGGAYFTDLGNTPQTDKPGTWDMATDSWFPDWFGNNGRTTIQPLFQTNCVLGTVNVGCYSNPAVDGLISRALRAPTDAAAAPLWHQADVDVMKDAAIVPLVSQNAAQYASSRVRSAGVGTANFSPAIQGWDLTNIWLSPNTP